MPGIQTTFDARQIMDQRGLKDGPLDIFFNQDEWIEPSRKLLDAEVDGLPKRRVRDWLIGAKPYDGAMRLEPPEDADLKEWGDMLARRFDLPGLMSELEPGDKAVWITGAVWARNAPVALGSFARWLATRAAEVQMSRVQIRVARRKPDWISLPGEPDEPY